MKATTSVGDLVEIPECYIQIPGKRTIRFKILPDIGDQKGAKYSGEDVIGRSSPIVVYNNSDARKISMDLHFITLKREDIERNKRDLWAIMSCSYPNPGENGVPYKPPSICRLKCGHLLGRSGVCAILESYNVKYAPDVPWDRATMLPYKFDVSTSWQVVYASSNLPGADRIFSSGA